MITLTVVNGNASQARKRISRTKPAIKSKARTTVKNFRNFSIMPSFPFRFARLDLSLVTKTIIRNWHAVNTTGY